MPFFYPIFTIRQIGAYVERQAVHGYKPAGTHTDSSSSGSKLACNGCGRGSGKLRA